MKDRLYSLIACVLAWAVSALLFATGCFGSPEGAFAEAVALLDTNAGKVLGMLYGALFLFMLGISCLGDALFYRKKADQKGSDQL